VITKGERTELKSIVRYQFKVLRSETRQRQAELLAEMEARIAEHYADEDKRQQDLMWKCQEIIEDARRQITDVLLGEKVDRGYRGTEDEISIRRPVRVEMETI
jgi:hypothetical protein